MYIQHLNKETVFPQIDTNINEEVLAKACWEASVFIASTAAVVSFVATIYLNSTIALVALAVSGLALSALMATEGSRQYASYCPTPLQSLLCYLRAADREAFATIASSLFYFVDLTKQPSVGSQTPILLVHGYLHNSSAWVYLHRCLESEGFGPIYTINLGSPIKSIEEYSQLIAEQAKIIKDETKNPNLILIGHSMGGVASSYYAVNDAPEGSVKEVITLNSPLNGTKRAVFGVGKCVRQMEYSSDFTNQLVQRIKETTSIHFTMIGSYADLVIYPSESAIPITDKPHVVTKMYDDVGHVFTLFSYRVASFIIDSLKS